MKKNLPLALGTLIASSALTNAALVAHYKLDESSGTGAIDSVGGQNAVQDSGTVAWLPSGGIIGGAVDIANTDLRIPHPLLAGASAFTISAWVNLDSTAGGYKGIFMSRGDGNGSNWGFAHNPIGGDFGIDYRFDNNGNGSDGKDIINNSLVGNWVHMVQVWRNDGSGETYLNNVAGPTKTGSSTSFVDEANPQWFIGSDIDRRMNGQIDDIAVWNEELSVAQIGMVYNGGLAGIDAPTSLIPEPGSVALALLGGLLVFRRRR